MSDRTWNPIDSKLYDEDWSQGAIIIAACLLAKCPNQYGVFDMPWGFINRFYGGIFTREEIQGFATEWEEAGFVKFYDNRKKVWIVKKWKRDKWNSAETNRKGAMTFIKNNYPCVLEDFRTMYELCSSILSTKLERGRNLVCTSDSDSDTDTEIKSKNVGTAKKPNPTVVPNIKPSKKSSQKKIKPFRDCEPRNNNEIILKRFDYLYHQKTKTGCFKVADVKKAIPQNNAKHLLELFKDHTNPVEVILETIDFYFSDRDKFSYSQKWNSFIQNATDIYNSMLTYNKKSSDNGIDEVDREIMGYYGIK